MPLAEGRLLAGSMAAAGIAGWEIAEAVTRRLPAPLAQVPAKLRRRWAQTAAFEPDMARRLTRMGEAVGAQLRGARRA